MIRAAMEACPPENCITSDKCEEIVKSPLAACKENGAICCSVVKSEFRTHCRHHGGECMDSCSMALQRDTVDCATGEVCCVLV